MEALSELPAIIEAKSRSVSSQEICYFRDEELLSSLSSHHCKQTEFSSFPLSTPKNSRVLGHAVKRTAFRENKRGIRSFPAGLKEISCRMRMGGTSCQIYPEQSPRRKFSQPPPLQIRSQEDKVTVSNRDPLRHTGRVNWHRDLKAQHITTTYSG